MGVRAELFDAAGTVVPLDDSDGFSFNAAGDFDDLLDRSGTGSASVLGRVDPFGTLALTVVDMPGLIADIDKLSPHARPGPEGNGLRRLRLLACHCAQLPGARLVFQGD
jgi:hypothetical protein